MPTSIIVVRTWTSDHNIMQHPQMLHEEFEPTTLNMSQHIAAMLANVGLACFDRRSRLKIEWA